MTKELFTKIQAICETTDLNSIFDLKQIDSLARAEIIVEVECDLGVELSNAEIMRLSTFGDLEDLIAVRSGGNGD